MICVECSTLLYGVQRVAEIASKIEEKLIEMSEFLRVKALQNIVLGSYPFLKDHLHNFTFFLKVFRFFFFFFF